MKNLTVYVDGSYNKDTKVYGYGMVIITNTEILQRKGSGIDTEGVWNVAGEVSGAIRAVEYALENGYDKLTVCHDYEGIQKWADGEWKAKKTISKNYVDVVRNARQSGLDISFKKIKAHSGNTYNEHADRLAKEAVESRSEGFTLGESGKGVAFHVSEEGKTYRAYAEDIVNQVMDYAKAAHKASPHDFTMQVLVEALHQITEDKIKC